MTGRRLAWLVLALLMIAVPGRTSRQDVDHRKNGPPPEILNRIISLDLKNVPLEQALALIARKGRFLLNFNRSRIPVDRIVSVKMTDAAVGDVLETILRDSGAELIVTSGGQLAIVPSSSLTTTSPPRVGTIQGRVCERQTGAPLSGVEIRLAAGRARAVSDGRIRAPPPRAP